MKSYRKTLLILLVLFLLGTVCGCAKKEEGPSYPDRDVDYPTELPVFEEDGVYIHYQREDNTYDNWTLWLWDPDGEDDSLEDDFNYQDDYGVIAAYPLSHFSSSPMSRLGFIVKHKGSWAVKDGTDSDRFLDFSTVRKDENNIYHIYLAGKDPNIYDSPEKIIRESLKSASFLNENSLYLEASQPLETYRLYGDGELLIEGDGAGRTRFTDRLAVVADFSKSYEVEAEFRESGTVLRMPVSLWGLYDSDSFHEEYYYDGVLGAFYSPEKTEFRVWSPVSSRITLRLYDSGTPVSVSPNGNDDFTEAEMVKGEKGVFSYTAEGDLNGKYYTYYVYNSTYPDGEEIVDPYAKAAGVSGLRGMVVDLSKTDPKGWNTVDHLSYDRKQLTVYETHVADVTSSETWNGPKELSHTYAGLIEKGTSYSEGGKTVSTGFDHIRELGVNAVQLLPVFDQANDETAYKFNWGYNPLNYNVPEGMYSSDPYDGAVRIRELKEVVKAFHEEGIAVIMDVVYNHVNGALLSNFDVLMPGYYYRYLNNGTLSNGSGCGNETASERSMVRKFIIDSVSYWLDEYRLDGFRFDLMGLHDIGTMNEVAKAAKAIDPYVTIYGEPWTGGATPLPEEEQAKQINAHKFEGYGQFNDQMRDALIMGGLHGASEKGWITGGEITKGLLESIEEGLNGATVGSTVKLYDPDKTVNYVTCHDNYTLYDRIKAAGIENEETVRKMAILANSLVFTSKGTAFMLGGEEFLRSKQGDSNSYQSGDEINGFDYSLKIRNQDVFETYQKLIAFKQETKALQGTEELSVEDYDNGAVISLSFNSNGRDYLILYRNGSPSSSSFDCSGYEVYLDTADNHEGNITLKEYQTLILYK